MARLISAPIWSGHTSWPLFDNISDFNVHVSALGLKNRNKIVIFMGLY